LVAGGVFDVKHGSLFAGIGGFDLGFERAGVETVWTVENDKSCNQVLATHWPDIKRYGDVKEVGKRNLESVDIISGGFPCQDLSVAGRREGLAGDRSGLWFEFARVIREMEPEWVVVENVPGLFSSNGGTDFAVIVRTLEQFGYCVVWRVLDSQYFGVPQRRRRVFIVGSLGDGGAIEVLFERESGERNPAKSTGEGKDIAYALAASVRGTGDGHGQGWNTTYVTGPISSNPTGGMDSYQRNLVALGVSENQRAEVLLTPYSRQLTSGGGKAGQGYPAIMVAPTLSAKNEVPSSSTQRDAWYEQSVQLFGTVRRLTPTECERLQGFPDGWTEGLSDTQRYKTLGNAVTVNVAEWIGKRIVAA